MARYEGTDWADNAERDTTELERMATHYADMSIAVARNEERISMMQGELEALWRENESLKDQRAKVRRGIMDILEPAEKAMDDGPAEWRKEDAASQLVDRAMGKAPRISTEKTDGRY